MYLIVGLGNPEEDYSETRHNMGFNVINLIAKEYKIDVAHTKFRGIYGAGKINEEKVILLKPQTYMNLSGESVIEFKNYYKIDIKHIIVTYDDIDLEPGIIRVRKQGSAGTHNGMRSIVQHLKTEEFARVRVGIGRPEYGNCDLIKHVIGHISEEEYKKLDVGVVKAKDAIVNIIKQGIENTMNKFN